MIYVLENKLIAVNAFARLYRDYINCCYRVTIDGWFKSSFKAGSDEEAINRFFKKEY